MRVYEAEQYQVNDTAMHQDFDLWWSDFEEAGIDRLFLAESEEGEVVGFQTISNDGLCIAIEVMPNHQGNGVGRMLIAESGCWRPERNECPEFWEKMAKEFGW